MLSLSIVFFQQEQGRNLFILGQPFQPTESHSGCEIIRCFCSRLLVFPSPGGTVGLALTT